MRKLLALAFVVALLATACSTASPASPTTAPAKAGATGAAPGAAQTSAAPAAQPAQTSAAAAPAKPAPGVSADTITLGMVTPLTGGTASIGIDGKAGADAFVAWLNEKGGINGRKLKLIAQDDQYNPQSAVAATKYFVDQEPVLAIWGNIGTATSLATVPTLEAAGLPLLFPMALSTEFDKSKLVFQMQTGLDKIFEVVSNWLAKTNPKAKVGVFYQDDGTSAATVDGFKRGKTPVAVVQKFDRTATTYRPQLQALKDAGVDNVVAILNDSQHAAVVKEAQQMGLKVTWWTSLGVATPKFIELTGELSEGVNAVLTSVSPDSAPAAQFREAMQKYQGKAGGTYALNSWSGGLIMSAALKNVGKDPTREGLIKALESTKNFDSGGLMPPVTLSAASHVAVRAMKIVQVKGGKWTEISDWITAESVQ